jgi:3-oxoacyl-[acyl-carrier protein] reductase
VDLKLKGKLALVTGSTKGIGRAITEVLAREGADVIISGRNAAEVTQIAQEMAKKYAVQTYEAAFDLADENARAALFEQFPKVDILVNNAAIYAEKKLSALTEADFTHYLAVNSLSAVALSQYYLPKMLSANNDGRIIFIASEAAIQPPADMAHYSATKAFNLNIAKSFAQETKGTRVTVNTVMPGPTATEGVAAMLADTLPDVALEAREQIYMAENRPLSTIQRFIRPEEIGDFVAFVASPLAGAFSGEALRMDGGMVPTMF